VPGDSQHGAAGTGEAGGGVGLPVQGGVQGSTSAREMPNAGAMAQVSRPFQIALAAFVLFAGVWFIALHKPGSSGSSPSSPPAPAASPAPATPKVSANGAGSDGASTPVYHGAAPGVEGLTRAIDRAHGAVATSEQNAQQLGQDSAKASESTPAEAGAATPNAAAPNASTTVVHHAAAGTTTTVRHSATKTSVTVHKTVTPKSSAARAEALANVTAVVLKAEINSGQTVLLLFWNSKSTDDAAVFKEALKVVAHGKGKVVLHVAQPEQVSQYGSVTRGVQIFQTPTLLLFDKKGLAVTMTGLMDKYAIEQGIAEAKSGSVGA
jgi:hypothetical protein